MAAFLKTDDELKRTLGFLPDDESLDPQSSARMDSILKAAELYVQNAIGKNDKFYQSDEIKPLYKLACFAITANWFNHPSSAPSSTTAMSLIGQMRGSFDLYESEDQKNGSTSECGSTKPSN